MNGIKALTFDVGGSIFDWQTATRKAVRELARARGVDVDDGAFTMTWRRRMFEELAKVRSGELPWQNADELHRALLDELADAHPQLELSDSDRDDLNRAWHRLTPWPDTVEGLTRLRRRYVLASLSNGNVALLVNMAKNAGIPWDAVLSAELARHYKPDPQAYLTAADLLGLEPEQVMMVAAHKGDLRAAGALGFRTGYVPRPTEYGPNDDRDLTPDPDFDIVAIDFNDMASQLGL